MHDSLLVRRIQRLGDLPGNLQRLAQGKRPLGNQVGERRAVDEFQHEPVRGAGILEAVDVTNVRVIQRREHLRFPLEAREPIRIARDRFGQDFDRDIAIQLRVSGSIHFAHAAGADGGQDLVRAEPSSHGKGHAYLRCLREAFIVAL